MKCLRCGYCCINLFVAIVKDPELGIKEGNIISHEGKGKPCIHLRGSNPGEYSCAIHDQKWYKKTPCFQYDQIGKKNSDCRTGRYILTKREKI